MHLKWKKMQTKTYLAKTELNNPGLVAFYVRPVIK